MNSYFLMAVVFASVMSLFSSLVDAGEPKGGGGELKVLSFNIRYANPKDGANRWELRKQQVVQLIHDRSPDIIGLQEVLHQQMIFLKKELKTYQSVGVGRADGKTKGEYSPIFYDAKTFGLIESKTYWLSDSPDKPGSKSWGNSITRICNYAALKDKKTGQTIHVYNTHWDHRSAPSQLKSAEFIHKKLAGKKNLILMGDFNTTPASVAMKTLVKNLPVSDSWKNHHKKEEVGTFHGFHGKSTKRRIDFIFSDFTSTGSEIITAHQKGKYPSDHFPVFSRFKWDGR